MQIAEMKNSVAFVSDVSTEAVLIVTELQGTLGVMNRCSAGMLLRPSFAAYSIIYFITGTGNVARMLVIVE